MKAMIAIAVFGMCMVVAAAAYAGNASSTDLELSARS